MISWPMGMWLTATRMELLFTLQRMVLESQLGEKKQTILNNKKYFLCCSPVVDQRHARVDCSPDPLELEAGGQLVHLVAVVGAGTDHLGGGANEAQYDNIALCCR